MSFFITKRKLVVFILLLAGALLASLLAGCGGEREARAQSAADADAGIVAAVGTLQNPDNNAQLTIDILVGARKYLPPAAGVARAEIPPPRMSANQIMENPGAYADAAPPDPAPWGAGVWAGLATAGTVGLFLAKQLLPLVPGLGGPAKALVGMVADGVWALTAHKDQKAADKAKDAVAIAAQRAQPILEMLRQLDPATLPPELAQILNSQEVANGLAILAAANATREAGA